MLETTEFIFRFTIFVLIHSVLAMPSLKRRFGSGDGHLSQYYRLYYNIVSIIVFSWVMASFRNSDVLYVVPGVWSLALYAFQFIFLVMLFVCITQTGVAEFLGVSGFRRDSAKSQKLATKGLYQIVRHPLYLLSILFLISNPVITVRWLMLTFISSAYLLFGALIEEKRLLQQFGSEYSTYQRRVPFIIPRIFATSGETEP